MKRSHEELHRADCQFETIRRNAVDKYWKEESIGADALCSTHPPRIELPANRAIPGGWAVLLEFQSHWESLPVRHQSDAARLD